MITKRYDVSFMCLKEMPLCRRKSRDFKLNVKNKLVRWGVGGLGRMDAPGKFYAVFSLLVLVFPSTDTFVLLCFSSGSRGGYNKGKCTGSNVRCLYIYQYFCLDVTYWLVLFNYNTLRMGDFIYVFCTVWCMYVGFYNLNNRIYVGPYNF